MRSTFNLFITYNTEVMLLSDVLGLSTLVDAIDHAKPPGATEATVLGPFHTDDAPDCVYLFINSRHMF
jgi:hypothetical protein